MAASSPAPSFPGTRPGLTTARRLSGCQFKRDCTLPGGTLGLQPGKPPDKPRSLLTLLTDAVGSGSGQGHGEPPRPRSLAISAPAQPGRRFRGREGKFLYVNSELDSGPSGSGPLPLRALGPLPPLPNRLKPKLALAGGWGSRLGTPGRSRLGTRGSPSRPEGNSPRLGWRTWGNLLGHFQTGRLGSSSLTFFGLWCSSPMGPLGYMASARRTQGESGMWEKLDRRRRGLTLPGS